MPEAVHYTRRSALYYNGGSQALLSNAPSTALKKRTYRGPEKNQLFGRRHDGVYVRYFNNFLERVLRQRKLTEDIYFLY